MTSLLFPGLQFSPLTLEDRDTLSSFLRRYPQRLTGYTFAMLAAWQPLFRYEWAFAEEDLLLISCILEPGPFRHLLQPVGVMSPRVKQLIIDGAEALAYPLKIVGSSDQFLQEHVDWLRAFTVAEDRAVSNYLYSAEALALLPGRKYAKKRNLLSQASSLYEWSGEKLTGQTIDRCFTVLNSIQEEEHPVIEGMLKRELAALECTLKHFNEFEQQGLLISVDRRPVAFSIYEPISPTTVAVHFERALRSFKGLYQVINCETAKIIAGQGFQFINREEDVGDRGLRDAKMSYHPVEIIPAFEFAYRKPPASAN